MRYALRDRQVLNANDSGGNVYGCEWNVDRDHLHMRHHDCFVDQVEDARWCRILKLVGFADNLTMARRD